MSEQESERWALTPYATSSPALVQVAGKQLAIAAQLNQELDRGRMVAMLKLISSADAANLMSAKQPLDANLIERFKDRWSWKELSENRVLPWSIELIETFADRWDWRRLSKNTALPWSIGLIERFQDYFPCEYSRFNWQAEDYEEFEGWLELSENTSLPWSIELIERFGGRWAWRSLSTNESLPWTQELIEHFKERCDWGFADIFNPHPNSDPGADLELDWYPYFISAGLSGNEALPWTPQLIERYVTCWQWRALSGNEALPWTPELIECHEDRWQWCELSSNTALPWTDKLIERYEDRWQWGELSSNTALPWTDKLIERYEDRWEWGALSGNDALPWTYELIDLYKERWSWRVHRFCKKGLTENEALPWSLDLIERFVERWDWKSLSANKSLPWSLDLIERYADRWNWESLSENEALPWSLDLIQHNRNHWNRTGWDGLSKNTAMPWSLELIERLANRWNWDSLSKNETVPLSLDLIERFADRWNWQALSANKSFALPMLWQEDIIEIMACHFKVHDIRTKQTLNGQQAAALLSTQDDQRNPRLEDTVAKQSDRGYVFLDMNEDLARSGYEWQKAPPYLLMAYGYARRTIAAALLIQGIADKDNYNHTVSLFKGIQLQTVHTVEFQEKAARAAEVFMATYDPRINRNVIGLIVGLANAFKPFAALAPMEDWRMFSSLISQEG